MAPSRSKMWYDLGLSQKERVGIKGHHIKSSNVVHASNPNYDRIRIMLLMKVIEDILEHMGRSFQPQRYV